MSMIGDIQIGGTCTGCGNPVGGCNCGAGGTTNFVQVIPPVGKNNYRVEYRLGDTEVKVVWVDADYYEIDDGGVSFIVDKIGRVFTATDVFSVTWVRENQALPPITAPTWIPWKPFIPPPCRTQSRPPGCRGNAPTGVPFWPWPNTTIRYTTSGGPES